MTKQENTEIKVEDTIENLHRNIELMHEKSKEHEQCTLSISTLINYKVDINGYEEMLSVLNDQAESIASLGNFIAQQCNRIHCENKMQS